MKALYLLCSALWLFTLERASLAHGRIPALAACKASGIQLLPHDSKLDTSGFSPVTDNETASPFSENRLAVDTSSNPGSCTVPDSISFRIAFYNMENFFDCWHDSSKNDHDFTPAGVKGWGNAKYANKRNRLFKVIAALDAECPLAAIGLAEVENARVLRELCRGTPLRYKSFDFVHFESPDPRGIDVALLYRKDLLQVDTAYPIALVIPPDSVARTRDILYVRTILSTESLQTRNPPSTNPPEEDRPAKQACTTKERSAPRQDEGLFLETSHARLRENICSGKIRLHLFVCHFPSKYGGATETDHKRAAAACLLRQRMDNLSCKDSSAIILAMGDLNTHALDSVLAPLRSQPYLNLMASPTWRPRFARYRIGSHKFREEWSTIDHIILPRRILPWIRGNQAFVFARGFLLQSDERYMGIKPFRSFYGARHLGGYSDHLPVYIDLCLPARPDDRFGARPPDCRPLEPNLPGPNKEPAAAGA